MPDIEKPTSGVVDDAEHNMDDLKKMDATQEANAVGYREYLEALDLEISDKEVCSTYQLRPLTARGVLSFKLTLFVSVF